MSDELAEYKIEHPACGHMQTIKARKHQSIADYNTRLVPELREALDSIQCEECSKKKIEPVKRDIEQDKADLIKQKLMQEMKKR